MRWFKPSIRNSISALLSPEVHKDPGQALEPVRKAMLDVLGDDGAQNNPQ